MEPVQLICQNKLAKLLQLSYKLRYEVLVAELGRKITPVDHKNLLVKDTLDDDGFHLLKMDNGKVVGAFRANYLSDIKDPFYLKNNGIESFNRCSLKDKVAVVSRLVLNKKYRGRTIFKYLITTMFSELVKSGKTIIVMECIAEHENLYRKIGFFPFGDSFMHKEGMRAIRMVLDANNRAWMETVGSICLNCYPENFIENKSITKRIKKMINN